MAIKVCVGRVAWVETLVEDLLGMTAVVAIQRLVVFAPHRLVADAVDVDATVCGCGCGKAARVARPQVGELADEAAGQGKPVAVRQQTALGLPVVYWRFVSPETPIGTCLSGRSLGFRSSSGLAAVIGRRTGARDQDGERPLWRR